MHALLFINIKNFTGMKKTILSFKTIAIALVSGTLFITGCQKDKVVTPEQQQEAIMSSAAKSKDVAPNPANDNKFDAEEKAVMDKWEAKMNAMEMTCEPDVTFAKMQIMHHQMGVEMADVALKYEHHKEGTKLTEKSRDANLKSKQRLEQYLSQHKTNKYLPAVKCEAFKKEMRRELVLMQQGMDEAMANDRNDVDIDFSELIIQHHKGAIAMSSVELEYGHDKQIRNEASKLIDEQAKEIQDFSEFKNTHVY